ncbi:hypothetical protein GCM10010977_06110 [Citricoccus zhacaiensis]|uniref:YcxB family protein n=1 Tax=Citricoccus zhacaiensis TaxID=489142 RepID=A0ABQ2LQ49_9MICC|nr:hypothetical protein [Citricoccus zhacaiensis]GGO41708.1 hypothetical protein GCM10010977_06110 [Citricoccus zhacaiensis]
MRLSRRTRTTQWGTYSGSLMLYRQVTAPSAHDPVKVSGFMIGVCIAVAALGVLILVMSGSMMLQGEFSASGTGRSRWMTPPIAFLLGLGLALSPIGIVWQERHFGRVRDRSDETWRSVLSLAPDHVFFHEGPAEGFYLWRQVTPELWASEPREVAAVVGHYLEHPEDRPELGTHPSVERALSLS